VLELRRTEREEASNVTFTRDYDKDLVLRWDDIENYLSDDGKRRLIYLTETVAISRQHDGKKVNTYVVVNEDEP